MRALQSFLVVHFRNYVADDFAHLFDAVDGLSAFLMRLASMMVVHGGIPVTT